MMRRVISLNVKRELRRVKNSSMAVYEYGLEADYPSKNFESIFIKIGF